jgi:hypothetical protein
LYLHAPMYITIAKKCKLFYALINNLLMNFMGISMQ